MTRIPFHPLLFATLPVLSMFAAHVGERHTRELQDSLLVVVMVFGCLLLAASAVYRDVRKAALLLSVFVILVLAWESLYEALDSIRIAGWEPRRRYVLPPLYLAVAASSVWLYRQRSGIERLTGLANVVAIGAVLPPLFTLGIAYTTSPGGGLAEQDALVAGTVTSRPDIYYLVFDRYGDDETARGAGLDNDIDEYLASKGFYVPRASRSNYIKTALSLSSSLNVDYLDAIVRGREQSNEWWPVYAHLARHRVGTFLRSQGYSYTHLGSWFYPTLDNTQATHNINYYTAVPRGVMRLFDSVALAPLRVIQPTWFDYRVQDWHRVRRQVDDVAQLVSSPGPKFVFLHVLIPHPPYIFDRDGRYVTRDDENRRSFAENYRNQVLAANAMIRSLVDAILERSSSPPVIIVQGDEGPYPPGTARGTFDWGTAAPDVLRMRAGILNAYYLPGVSPHVLYPTISPVNSFRIVFNTYFGTNLPMLPDRTFRHGSEVDPFPLVDVTDRLTPLTHAVNAREP